MSDDPFGDLLAGSNAAPPANAPQQSAPQDDDPFGRLLANPQAEKKEGEGEVPAWSEIPGQAVSNAGASTGRFFNNMYQTVRHPIQSAENLGSIGLGVLEKIGGKLGLPHDQGYEQYADAVGEALIHRYGSVDNIKRTLATDPIGVAADVSALFTGGGSLAARLPGMAGRIGEGVAAIGRTADPLNTITKPIAGAAKLAGVGTKELLGWRAGTGPEAVEAAASAGYQGGEAATALQQNIRQQVPVENVVHDALGAIDNMVQGKNAAYKHGIAEAGIDTMPISAPSFQKVISAINEADKIGNFKGWRNNESAAKANADLRGMVTGFINERPNLHTVEGLDALKQSIGDYKREHVDPGSKGAVVADTYYNAVLDAIKAQAPKYAQVMENYSDAKELLGQIQKSFSLPPDQRKLNIDTALRKLQSTMRNNVNSNYGYRRTLMENLEAAGVPNMRYALAGQALTAKVPRGIPRIAAETGVEIAGGLLSIFTGHLNLLPAALLSGAFTALTSSPRAIGEAAYYAGRAASPAKYAKYVVNKPAARAAQQLGKLPNVEIRPIQEARGGKIERAIRATKRG